MEKRKVKKRYIVLVVLLVLLAGVIAFACWAFVPFRTEGIRDGSYRYCDANGNYLPGTGEGLEGDWQIWRGEATYLYGEYKVIKEGDTIYFQYVFDEDFRLKAEYDKPKKMLTVYMTALRSPHVPEPGAEISPYYFRYVD